MGHEQFLLQWIHVFFHHELVVRLLYLVYYDTNHRELVSHMNKVLDSDDGVKIANKAFTKDFVSYFIDILRYCQYSLRYL